MVENPNSIPDNISNAVSNLFSSVNFDALAILETPLKCSIDA
jgi:hypothetical protein